MPNKQTFLDMARTWKYCGLPENIEFEFAILNGNASKEAVRNIELSFIPYAVGLLNNSTLEAAEGFFAAMLVRATVPGVIEYTVGGGKRNG